MTLRISLICATLLFVICVTDAAVARGPPQTHPDHPGKCWDKQSKRVYVPGQEVTAPDSCTLLYCDENFSLTYTTCGVKATEKGRCKLVPNLSLDYPNCCEYECP